MQTERASNLRVTLRNKHTAFSQNALRSKMADVTGPISTLPGSAHHHLPEGQKCDCHPDRPATVRYQGETDSFGCEMHDLCDECFKEFRAADRSPEARTGRCDWCKHDATDLAPQRDIDEGMAGPVYDVCGTCRKKYDDELRAELAAYDDHYFGDDDDAEYEESWEAEMNCSMGPDGQCGQAGSEYCDLECPFRH